MINRYWLHGVAGLVFAGLVCSATESRWFYSLKESFLRRVPVQNESYDVFNVNGVEVRVNNRLLPDMSEFFDSFDLPKYETICPEHEVINGYVPVTKDPRVIYFWNRERSINTNSAKKIKYDKKLLKGTV